MERKQENCLCLQIFTESPKDFTKKKNPVKLINRFLKVQNVKRQLHFSTVTTNRLKQKEDNPIYNIIKIINT